MTLILTADEPNCPQCGAVLVRVDRRQRICTSCGMVANFWSLDDERERKEATPPRERAFKEEHGVTEIGKWKVRW